MGWKLGKFVPRFYRTPVLIMVGKGAAEHRSTHSSGSSRRSPKHVNVLAPSHRTPLSHQFNPFELTAFVCETQWLLKMVPMHRTRSQQSIFSRSSGVTFNGNLGSFPFSFLSGGCRDVAFFNPLVRILQPKYVEPPFSRRGRWVSLAAYTLKPLIFRSLVM